MKHTTIFSILLFSLLLASATVADQTLCTKDDVTGQWTNYSIGLNISDHVEYQQKTDIVYLKTVDGIDQFQVSLSGAFSSTDKLWQGQCRGDQYVLRGEIGSHDNFHSIQAFRNAAAPATDQCSLERCESTCVADLQAQCSISKSVSARKMTFIFLPGHTTLEDTQYLSSEPGCNSHDCNHPGVYHSGGGIGDT